MTELIDFFWIIFALYIYFIASISLFFLFSTFQTLPNPPFPIGYKILKQTLFILSGFGW